MTTTTPPPDHTPTVSWLLIREGDWARLFQIAGHPSDPSLIQGLKDLKRHCEGAYHAQEPLGDVWCLPQDHGDPQRVTVTGSATPYDEDDYATQTITFWYISLSRFHERVDICSISFRLDGRS